MGKIDYGEIQQVLDDLLGQNVDFQNMAEQGASGNSPISFQNLLKMAEGLFFRELMEQRSPRYEAAADLAVDTDGKSVDEICREILSRVLETAEI